MLINIKGKEVISTVFRESFDDPWLIPLSVPVPFKNSPIVRLSFRGISVNGLTNSAAKTGQCWKWKSIAGRAKEKKPAVPG